MSFFNSLQEYVSTGVANLTLSPKRFSLSREGSESTSEQGPPPSPAHGYPKVVPLPGATSPVPRMRRKTLECPPGPGLGVPTTPRRVGSFRHQRAARTPLMFCRRRQSWPEFDNQATSGVQETDGSFFESFTALPWKQENRRLLTHQELEEGVREPPSPPHRRPDSEISARELDQLYVEVLYTIKNKVGATTGQYPHYQDELYRYAQEAFAVPNQRHRRLLAIAAEEKPPILVLNVVVVEAENLEAKDPNGFSDPYCMLGIQPGNASPISPQPSRDTPPLSPRMPACRALSDSGSDLDSPKHESHHEKLRKHHSQNQQYYLKRINASIENFRLSFKRRDTVGGRRERDSISSAVPAKFIRATSVRPQTLNPRWNEKFRFDIDDVNSDILHLDIWDHDDESSVLDAVSRLNEVRGVKGLGRFFKQIAQSARSGSQDDFLGCVNAPLQDIPSTGLDCWFKLEARSQRSNIQGRIRLKMWLSTREDRGTSEEDNWADIRQQEQLSRVLIAYELSRQRGRSWEWSGELPQVAQNILHQHAIQGDITELQLALVRCAAFAKLSQERTLDPRILYRHLQELDLAWGTDNVSKEEEEWLAESLTSFVEHALLIVRRHRILYPPHHRTALPRFDYLLRCLGLLSNMRAFRKCCPFHKEIRGEIVLALKKGTAEWFEETQSKALGQTEVAHSEIGKLEASLQALAGFVMALVVDLQSNITAFNPLFEQSSGIQYFNAVYKQLEKMVSHDMGPRVSALCSSLKSAAYHGGAPPQHVGTAAFELYLAVQEFVGLKDHLPHADQKTVMVGYHEWFEPAVDLWLDVAKVRALHRIKAAFELNRLVTGERIVKHSTSAVDATACFYQVLLMYKIQEMWRQLSWPDLMASYDLVMKVISIITTASLYFSDLLQQRLQDTGYYEDNGPFQVTDEMCVAVNDLENVRRSLSTLGTTLGVDAVLEAIEAAEGEGVVEWRDALYGALEETQLTLEARALQVISRVGVRLRPSLKKATFHLAWSPDSLPTEEAIAPLLELLDGQLISLNAALLPRNFERVLADVWDSALLELGAQVDSSSGEKVAVFYERLQKALNLLLGFFHAEGKGLTMEALQSPTYRQVEQRLVYHRTDTDHLIRQFFQQRLEEQLRMEVIEYGVLSVRAYFNHDSLCVEVLHARDVIPLDPNGFSDPFVIIELLPRRLFAQCAEQQTNVHKKTLHPVFDECFEFSVTIEQCRSDGAMILFTVMDHDVLTANDFAGEAFLSLQTIPGVADNSASIDNFHGLKTQDLALMHQKNKSHPILQILETRVWDRAAQEFVRKQKLRFAAPS